MRYFMLNKPPGCICARRDHRGRSVVYDHVPRHYPSLPHAGRLDFNTEGLLLFTDDGRLQQALLNHRFRGRADPDQVPPIEKEYHVKVHQRLHPDDPRLLQLAEPLEFTQGEYTRPARVDIVTYRRNSTWIAVTITEGRYRQVRRLCDRARIHLVKLRRVRVGPLCLGDLKLRWCRPLTEEEVAALYQAALPLDERPGYDTIADRLWEDGATPREPFPPGCQVSYRPDGTPVLLTPPDEE